MITNFKKLSETLDRAASAPSSAPGELVAAIRADKERINREIQESGTSFVTIDGHKFKVVRPPQS
jgi:hypothetical protein